MRLGLIAMSGIRAHDKELTELGLAALPDFWERVDALGDRRYYAPVDMPGMP